MDIFESLENLNVSEECFDDIIGIVEEYINELKAPTPELAKKVFDRKEGQLRSNSAKVAYHAQQAHNIEDNKSDFHTKNPYASTQDRYDIVSAHKNQANKLGQEGHKLVQGAKRLSRWAQKKSKQGKLGTDAGLSNNKMVHTGQENERVRFENAI